MARDETGEVGMEEIMEIKNTVSHEETLTAFVPNCLSIMFV